MDIQFCLKQCGVGQGMSISGHSFPHSHVGVIVLPAITSSEGCKGEKGNGQRKHYYKLGVGSIFEVLQTCPHSNPRTHDYVSLSNKGDFADVIKLRVFGWGDYPDQPNVITEILIRGRGRQEGQLQRSIELLVLKMEEGATNQSM